jgi:hypothetical protein
MSNEVTSPSFISRVVTNDITRKGIAGAIGALVVATVAEILWPST